MLMVEDLISEDTDNPVIHGDAGDFAGSFIVIYLANSEACSFHSFLCRRFLRRTAELVFCFQFFDRSVVILPFASKLTLIPRQECMLTLPPASFVTAG